MSSITSVLSNVCVAAALVCGFAALVLYAMGKLSDTQGARGEAMMIGCIIAAACFTAAAAFINGQAVSSAFSALNTTP